jgi:hypothetical protein
MEAMQSYYMAKSKETPQPLSHIKYIHCMALQCAIETLCEILDIETIRNSVLFRKFPDLDCGLECLSNVAEDMPGFHIDDLCDASNNRARDSIMQIVEIIPAPMVIPIKTVHNSKMENQYIIIDKMMMEVYMIDPTEQCTLITNPCKRIAAFFQTQGYHCNSVLLPNNKSMHMAERFRNSWTFFVLIESLAQLQSPFKCVGTIHYPEKTQYLLLFDFYKNIVLHIPEVQRDLRHTFIEKMNKNKSQQTKWQGASYKKIFETIIQLDPTEIILSTPGNDIIYAAFCGRF